MVFTYRLLSWRPLRPRQIFKTARNLTLPEIMCAYASAARSSANVSIIGRTPLMVANLSASSDSTDVPDGQPTTDLRAAINCADENGEGSKLTPTITNLPSTPRPSIRLLVALLSGAVARIT